MARILCCTQQAGRDSGQVFTGCFVEAWGSVADHSQPCYRVLISSCSGSGNSLGVSQLPKSGGHPQTDGLTIIERFNRALKQILSKLVSKGSRGWDQLLRPVLFAYRITPHASTGMSPFYLMYGRDPKFPSSLDFQTPTSKFPIIETEYGRELERELTGKTVGKATY